VGNILFAADESKTLVMNALTGNPIGDAFDDQGMELEKLVKGMHVCSYSKEENRYFIFHVLTGAPTLDPYTDLKSCVETLHILFGHFGDGIQDY